MAVTWGLPHMQTTPFVLVPVDPNVAKAWGDVLKIVVHRCYITDDEFKRRVMRGVSGLTQLVGCHGTSA